MSDEAAQATPLFDEIVAVCRKSPSDLATIARAIGMTPSNAHWAVAAAVEHDRIRVTGYGLYEAVLGDGQLLPCPFCGGDAEYGEVGGEGDDAGGQFIQCANARCGASSALIFPCGDEPKPLLRERWNRRTP